MSALSRSRRARRKGGCLDSRQCLPPLPCPPPPQHDTHLLLVVLQRACLRQVVLPMVQRVIHRAHAPHAHAHARGPAVEPPPVQAKQPLLLEVLLAEACVEQPRHGGVGPQPPHRRGLGREGAAGGREGGKEACLDTGQWKFKPPQAYTHLFFRPLLFTLLTFPPLVQRERLQVVRRRGRPPPKLPGPHC